MINNIIKLRRFGRAGITLAVIFQLGSCATLINSDNKVDISAYSNKTSVQAIKTLESNLKQSAENDLNVYAPKHYLTADKALIDARSLISQNQPREKIVRKVAVAEAILRNGDIVMRKIKDVLDEQLVVKDKLDHLKTKKVYRSEYSSLVERLNNIIHEIEDGNLQNNEENRVKLLHDLQKLERRSIRYNAMHESEEILKRVKYRGGKTLAPITFQDASAVFKRADDFIGQNPNYESGIEQMGQESLFAAKRALYITEQVAALSQKINISLEQVVLDEEYRLYRVARELNSVDLRDNPLEMQSEILAKIAKNKANEYQSKEELIIALRNTLIEVRDSSAQLTALSDTSIKLKKEKDEWLAKEALFTAKVSHLEESLQKSQLQLDQTQQKLLGFKDENKKLFSRLNIEKENSRDLKNRVTKEKAKVDAAILKANTASLKADAANKKADEATKTAAAASAEAATARKEAAETKKQMLRKTSPTTHVDRSNRANSQKKIAKEKKRLNNSSDNNSTKKKVETTTSLKQPLTLTERHSKPQSIKNKPDQKKINMANKKVAVATTLKNDMTHSKITEKETIDALNSVMKLLNKFESKNTNKSDNSKLKNKTFVDASSE